MLQISYLHRICLCKELQLGLTLDRIIAQIQPLKAAIKLWTMNFSLLILFFLQTFDHNMLLQRL